MKPPINEIALPGQVVCGNIWCPVRNECYHAEPHDDNSNCGKCNNSPGCLPVKEVAKLAAIEAAEDEGQRRQDGNF